MLRAGLLTLALVLLTAAPARAAFDVTAFEVTPADTAAGAHADVTIATSFTPYADGGEQPRNVTFHLPPGLAGDPFATPRCSEADYRADACPAATKVGSVAASAQAIVLGLPVHQDVTGDLYNLEPAGPEPARLGAVLRPLGGLLGKLFVPTVIQARASDGGLDSLVTDLPTSSGGIQIYTERMAFTLQGRPAGGTGPFMRNPTSCKPATSTVEASSYQQPTVVSKTASFTPTDCGALEFSPHIEGVVGARGQTARRAKPPVRTVIAQGAEQAGQAAVTVLLPQIISADLTQLGRACPPDKVALRACPDSARIGSVEAATPLLAKPLTGSVYFAAKPVGQLPGLVIQLDDPIPLRLEGAVELSPTGIKTTFTGLPDVPLARFALNLQGGASGAFQLAADVCSASPPPAVAATFVAQSGKQTSETRPLKLEGCTAPPRAWAKVTRLRGGRPRVVLGVAAADGAPDLRTLRVLLPDALQVRPKRARRGVRARTAGGQLARSAVKLSRDGDLRLTLPAGTRTVTATLAKGAVRVGRKLRRARKPRRLAFRFLVADADGPREASTLKVRPRRR